jgi:hypothetical protein
MLYAISWSVILILLTLWSLAAWLLHTATSWAMSSAGSLPELLGGAKPQGLPEWLAAWLPPELVQALSAWLPALAQAFDSLLQAAPALGSGLGIAVGVIWALGSLLLAILGVGLHAMLMYAKRRAGGISTLQAGGSPAS